ncbi:sulfurtransferase complex subunit TusD [Hahella sp. CR1]|uniref:sulfurtransferase complex subunit TusD n=1 Tax=Hahella sp. CR1 TaxID=2992807 RepID=UPI002442357E|nr:sulfurtransferase complex subunit TusD [Hahella sp. CR1]MDG9671873.1 sulfurtransferase complex subunit TusD [Hahella sp. CR1]
MKYTIVVYGAPFSSQAPYSACQFAKAVLARGHSIYRIFFYHDGVLNASSLSIAPQDDAYLPAEWGTLKREHNLDLVACIGASVKRGVITPSEAERYQRSGDSLQSEFELSGLGQLVDAALYSDRVITFGAG